MGDAQRQNWGAYVDGTPPGAQLDAQEMWVAAPGLGCNPDDLTVHKSEQLPERSFGEDKLRR